jgi:BirA family biotin operon repressor/biotin-[acetyl-CoA-carboxylase] ligase
MELPRAENSAARLRYVAEAVSTNDSLAALAADPDEPTLSVFLTLSQTAGRGRLGRSWIAPPGKTLAVSVLIRPLLPSGEPVGIENLGWLPLLAGTAMTRAIDALVGHARTTLKWPNDVLIDGRKVCGILAELLPSGNGVIIGAGVNLTLGEDDLPVPTATSLAIAGVAGAGTGAADAELVDAVLGGYLEFLAELLERFLAGGADARGSGILSEVARVCSTLGQDVRVELPGGTTLTGVAKALDASGRLEVLSGANGEIQAVAAGDVTHLRYE